MNLLSGINPFPLQLISPNGKAYGYKGKILFANRQVDRQTGTIVLLSTPIAVLGAFGVLPLRPVVDLALLPPYMVQIENDVYARIGLVMLIGLAAKNAILIVAFAKEEYDRGRPLVESALDGARLRLRPILMTSFACIFGVVPLWVASGAGAVSRQIMGTTVIGGMTGASLIAIFFVPAIFCVVEKLSGARRQHALAPSRPSEAHAEGQ